MATARRGFLKSVAAVPLAPAALAPAAPPSGPEAVAEALAEAVKREFGQHLDAGKLDAVRKALAEGLERSARLRRSARLSNADEPVGRFEARPPAPKGKPR
jgi:hypothetical protein